MGNSAQFRKKKTIQTCLPNKGILKIIIFSFLKKEKKEKFFNSITTIKNIIQIEKIFYNSM